MQTRLTHMLGCRYPIIQTAMGWVADAKLVAATTSAGGFGFLAGAVMTAKEAEEGILEISQNKSFGSIKFKYKESEQKDNTNILRA